jgi:hypothetical protein
MNSGTKTTAESSFCAIGVDVGGTKNCLVRCSKGELLLQDALRLCEELAAGLRMCD